MKSIIRHAIFLAICGCLISPTAEAQTASPWEKEIVYQIFPRSFFDSNGDHVGDLNGITKKLPFLHDLGITAILINPIFKAREYHNYFADDFFNVDPTLGTNADFFHLIRAAHARRIKVILDMEIQYVADLHPWFMAAEKDPKSPFADYLWRTGSAFYGMKINWFGGAKVNIASINPDNPNVRNYAKHIFRFWAAPNGKPQNGVDGFRIDHMMDDLDNKHVKTGMLKNFWLPIERDIKSINPKAFFLAEQADWAYGKDMFEKADVDAVYAVPLRFLFVRLDKAKLEKSIEETEKATPKGKTQFVFIENHDLERFASVAKQNQALLRLGAVFNLTMKGTPLIYYGQELGMSGIQGKWNSDTNDIPIRLAYRWKSKVDSPGAANFYRNTGPWDKTGYVRDNDGVSLEEEAPNKDSLFNFYKQLIALRKKSLALSVGYFQEMATSNPSVISYARKSNTQQVQVVMNLSDKPQEFSMSTILLGRNVLGSLREGQSDGNVYNLPAYGFGILSANR